MAWDVTTGVTLSNQIYQVGFAYKDSLWLRFRIITLCNYMYILLLSALIPYLSLKSSILKRY